jgi:hypothetical protein
MTYILRTAEAKHEVGKSWLLEFIADFVIYFAEIAWPWCYSRFIRYNAGSLDSG